MTKTINFPSITAKEIYEKSKNKVGSGKLLWNIDWYKNEDFFTKEKTRKGKREVIFELQYLGKSWNECTELGKKEGLEMLNFAEVLYLVWKEPEFRELLEHKYTWTSSQSSDGTFVNVGNFFSDGLDVFNVTRDDTDSYLGVCPARLVSRKLGKLDTSELDSSVFERLESLEKDMAKLKKIINL